MPLNDINNPSPAPSPSNVLTGPINAQLHEEDMLPVIAGTSTGGVTTPASQVPLDFNPTTVPAFSPPDFSGLITEIEGLFGAPQSPTSTTPPSSSSNLLLIIGIGVLAYVVFK